MIKKTKKQKIEKKFSSLNYLKESKRAIIFTILVFVFSTILGILNADYISELITPMLRELVEKTQDLNTFELFLYIFYNNSLTSLTGLFLGIFAAFIPIIIAFTNGIVLGFVLERTLQVAGIFEIWRLFPHGIFELPAVFISLGLGTKLGLDIFSNYMSKNKNKILKSSLGIISIFLALFSLYLFQSASASLTITLPEEAESVRYVLTLTFLFTGLLFITPFILLFFSADKRIMKFNIERIKASLKIFIFIIIPLLIIAAIIESILITFV